MTKGLHLVVFSIGAELYGVGIDAVHEIVTVPTMTEVPDAPDFLEGVINLRGRIIPVIDLKKRMKIKGGERTRASRVLITEDSSRVGLLVDSVSEVLKIQPDVIEDPPEVITAIGVDYITGVAKVGGRVIILLDIRKILSMEEMKKVGREVEALAGTEAA